MTQLDAGTAVRDRDLESERPPLLPWAVLGGLIGGAVRLTLIYAQERVHHDSPEHLVGQWMLASWWPSAIGSALVLAVALGSDRKSNPRWARRSAGLACATLLSLVLGGMLLGPERLSVGIQTDTGRKVWTALALGSLGLIGVLRAVVRWPLKFRGLLPLGLLALFATPTIGNFLRPRLGPQFDRQEVVLHLPENFDAVEIVHAPQGARIRPGVLTPSGDYRVDGADMPSLIVPPPGRVAFDVPEGAEGLHFDFTAGIDEQVLHQYEEYADRLGDYAVNFQVHVDGEAVWEDRVHLELHKSKQRGMAWLRPFADRGLPVESGARVELSSVLLGPDGEHARMRAPIKAGFGRCALVRYEEFDRAGADAEHPNVVVVMQDTQRADRLSTYGYEKDTSPNLTDLAERGVRFDDAAASSSWTWPSTASVLTGLTPLEHGIVNGSSCFLSDRFETLAEPWQESGMSTGGFTANPLIAASRNFDQGFEVFDDGPVFRRSKPVMRAALDWLQGVRQHRFGMYLHLASPHAPLLPLPIDRKLFAGDLPADLGNNDISFWQMSLTANEAFDEEHRLDLDRIMPEAHRRGASDLYDACTRTGDRHFGDLLQALERYELQSETLVLYTSDHGEELFDHGFATHGHTLFQELVRVPLVLAGPGVPAGQVISRPVENRHAMSTLIRLAGLGPRGPEDLLGPGEGFDGTQVLTTAEGWWNGHYRTPLFGLRKDRWVLHVAPEAGPWDAEPTEGGEWRLYDLESDPRELRDLSELEGLRAEGMRTELSERMETLLSRAPEHVFGGSAGTRELLERVGYVDSGGD